MRPLPQRNDPIRLFLRRLGTFALFVVLIFVLSGVWSVYQKQEESLAMRVQAESERAVLEDQQADLEGKIAELKTARGKEAALRQQYEVGRAGERLIVIVDRPAPPPVQASSTWQKWVHKFLPFW